MINLIAGFSITIISLLIGYLLGSSNESEERVTLKKVGKFIKRANPIRDKSIGAIERPTQKDILFKDKPWLKEEEDEMIKSLDNLNK